MTRLPIIALVALSPCMAAPAALAQNAEPTVVSGGDTTVVYVFPTSPQTFVPVAGLPSFLVMPGADSPPVATQVVYTTTRPVPSSPIGSVSDLDCSNFIGTVTISGPDRFGLDKDGDGIGCEPEDRA
jgi:hypothetical protein